MAKSRITRQFASTKSESTLLVLFIPSVDRNEREIDQETWVDDALNVLGRLFGGATAYPRARGVWRDDAQGGRLVFDDPVVIQCYTHESALEEHASELREFLVRMGEESNQGAVGFVIDRDYLEIQFPLQESAVARNVRKIADALGAQIVAKVPETGGGAFGAARLAAILHERLTPGTGRRPGRPTNPNWVKHPKVPMSEQTFCDLERLAEELSTPQRRVSPMQLAAQLLENSVEQLASESPPRRNRRVRETGA